MRTTEELLFKDDNGALDIEKLGMKDWLDDVIVNNRECLTYFEGHNDNLKILSTHFYAKPLVFLNSMQTLQKGPLFPRDHGYDKAKQCLEFYFLDKPFPDGFLQYPVLIDLITMFRQEYRCWLDMQCHQADFEEKITNFMNGKLANDDVFWSQFINITIQSINKYLKDDHSQGKERAEAFNFALTNRPFNRVEIKIYLLSLLRNTQTNLLKFILQEFSLYTNMKLSIQNLKDGLKLDFHNWKPSWDPDRLDSEILSITKLINANFSNFSAKKPTNEADNNLDDKISALERIEQEKKPDPRYSRWGITTTTTMVVSDGDQDENCQRDMKCNANEFKDKLSSFCENQLSVSDLPIFLHNLFIIATKGIQRYLAMEHPGAGNTRAKAFLNVLYTIDTDRADTNTISPKSICLYSLLVNTDTKLRFFVTKEFNQYNDYSPDPEYLAQLLLDIIIKEKNWEEGAVLQEVGSLATKINAAYSSDKIPEVLMKTVVCFCAQKKHSIQPASSTGFWGSLFASKKVEVRNLEEKKVESSEQDSSEFSSPEDINESESSSTSVLSSS